MNSTVTEFHSYSDNREEEFDADTFALTRLDRLLKERDMAQLDGYSVHSPGAANHMDLLVQYAGGERIAATGIPPQNNQYFNEEWFIDFFRNLSGAFGKNIFTDSFKEREQNNQYFNEEWFIDFFRNLSGAFGKNIFTDSFKEREQAERAFAAGWNSAVNNAKGTG